MSLEKHRESHAFRIDRADLAILLTQLRTSKGLTARDLSAMSDVTAAIINEIETCKRSPSFYTISKIFSAMGLTVSEAYSMIESGNTVN